MADYAVLIKEGIAAHCSRAQVPGTLAGRPGPGGEQQCCRARERAGDTNGEWESRDTGESS